MRNELFLDASYAIASSSSTDTYYERALQLAGRIEATRTRLITTRAVVLEIGNALARQRYRQSAVKLLDALEADPSVVIVPLSEEICARALSLSTERPDKEWGLTDCISFVAMQDCGITESLTTDEHFQQAGFRALLLDSSA